ERLGALREFLERGRIEGAASGRDRDADLHTATAPVGPKRSTRTCSGVTPSPTRSLLAASAKPADPHTRTRSSRRTADARSAAVRRPAGRLSPAGGSRV